MNTRKILMITTALASLSLAATSANAAEGYASIFGGASLLQDPNLSGTSHTHSTTYAFSSSQSLDTSFKTGFVVGGNFGVKWDSGLRTEVELSVRQNSSKSRGRLRTSAHSGYISTGGQYSSTSSDRIVSTDLRLRAYSLMANAWYDFDTGTSFTPYIGGGIGLAEVQIDGSIDGARIAEKNDMVFAWQVGAGVSFPLTDAIKGFAEYRYFAADAAHLRLEPGYHGGDVNADFNSHTLMVGLRFGL